MEIRAVPRRLPLLPRSGTKLLALALVAAAVGVLAPDASAASSYVRGKLRIYKVHYRAHTGAQRNAYVAVPTWYGKKRNPRLPLVISPHGRGLTGRSNLANFGQLPAVGGFVLVSPDGQGRLLDNYSWGALGQVEDLARMPEIVRRTLPWVRIDARKIYAFGGSMGGQETLLLVARHAQLLAGAAAFDPVVDFARQYRQFPNLRCDRRCLKTWNGPIGASLQELARRELGGTPRAEPYAYAVRSPLTYVRRIAFSCVPLQLWWSPADKIVIGQDRQTGHFYETLKKLKPDAPVQAYFGGWIHSREMTAETRLPVALAEFGLLPADLAARTAGITIIPAPPYPADGC